MPPKISKKTNKLAKKIVKQEKKIIKKAVSKPKQQTHKSSGLFNGIGTAVGGWLGGPLGATIGGGIGSWVSKITGSGAYKVNRNSLINSQTVPQFLRQGGGVTLAHAEYVTDVVGSTGFNSTTYSINPGLNGLFPWLSTLAQNFEEYEMLGLVFEYRPSSGSISSTQSLGVINMATQYNVYEQPFTSKVQMDSAEFAVSTVPNTTVLHPVECSRRQGAMGDLFIRTPTNIFALNTTPTLQLYDMGVFTIATEGQAAAVTIGELWVTYHVTLRRPRLLSQLATNLYSCHLRESPAASVSYSTNLLGSNPSGSFLSGTFNAYAGSGAAGGGSSFVTLVLPYPGQYIINTNGYFQASGAVASWNSEGIANLGANLEYGPNLFGDGTSYYSKSYPNSATSNANLCAVYAVTVTQYGTGTANQLTLTRVALNFTALVGTTDIVITTIPSTLTSPAREPIQDEEIVRQVLRAVQLAKSSGVSNDLTTTPYTLV